MNMRLSPGQSLMTGSRCVTSSSVAFMCWIRIPGDHMLSSPDLTSPCCYYCCNRRLWGTTRGQVLVSSRRGLEEGQGQGISSTENIGRSFVGVSGEFVEQELNALSQLSAGGLSSSPQMTDGVHLLEVRARNGGQGTTESLVKITREEVRRENPIF